LKLGFVGAWLLRNVGLEELVRWASEQGFKAIELPSLRPETHRVCAEYGVEVCAVGGGANVLVPDQARREEAVSTVKRTIEAAAGEGIGRVMMTHRRAEGLSLEENLKLFQEAFTPLAEHGEEHGVKVLMENWPADGMNLAFTPELWRRLFELVPSGSLGLCMDPSHLVWLGIDYLWATREFSDRIFYAHAKDTEILEDGLNEYGIYGRAIGGGRGPGAGWWRYRLPGYGEVDWAAFLDALYELGYDYVISIEHEDRVWGSNTDPDRGKRGLLLAKKYLEPFIVQ